MLRLCYQVSTPEVYPKPGITSFQGNLSKVFHFLKSCGYDDVELMVRDPKEIDVKTIEREVRKVGFTVPMICTGEIYGQDKLSFADIDSERREEAVERVKAAIDMAVVFGRRINLGRVRGGYSENVPKEKTYSQIIESIQEIVEYASKKSVYIALEPVNTLALNFVNTTQEGIELVQKINSPFFQLMVDTAHMHIEDKDVEQSLRMAKKYLLFVHVADSNRKYPGAGTFDFHQFFKALRSIDYQGAIGVEVFPVPDQETAALQSIKFIRPLLY